MFIQSRPRRKRSRFRQLPNLLDQRFQLRHRPRVLRQRLRRFAAGMMKYSTSPAIPRELEEAAEVDGANRIQIFFRLITPVALPAHASTAIIIFTQVWNEFLLALTLATPATQTTQMKLAEIKGSFVAH
jgi:hypothetical protein